MVFLSSRISPRASTVIFCDRSPFATAVVTWAMLRTWSVRLPAMKFTESVRSRHVPADPGHLRLPAEPALAAHLAGHPGDLVGERRQLVHHRVDGVLQLQDLAAGVHVDLLRQVTLGHRGGHLGDVADLGGEVARHRVDRVGEVLPGAGDAGHLGLPAEPSLGAHLAGHAGHLGGEQGELVDHAVEDGGDLAEQSVGLARQPGAEVAVAHGGQTRQQLAQLRLLGPVRCAVLTDGRLTHATTPLRFGRPRPGGTAVQLTAARAGSGQAKSTGAATSARTAERVCPSARRVLLRGCDRRRAGRSGR